MPMRTVLMLSVFFVAERAIAVEPLPGGADAARFYETQVQPILQANCLSCHGAEKKIQGGLRLTTREGVLKGGDSGPAINEKNLAESLIIKAVRGIGDVSQMPPKGKLATAQIEIIEAWVKRGVPFGAAKIEHHGPPKVDEKARNWWSYKPVVKPAVPQVADVGWVRNDVDAFVLAKLEAQGIKPAAATDKATLLRRVHYVLTGLPPSPAEVEAFLADKAPDAYEQAVDRLLASRHFGEHWARHWLDLVRYAESNSYERDGGKPSAWKYRDYVIRAFNQDKPYDQFIREQLAGDEFNPPTRDGMIATGYYRLGLWDDEPVDRELAYYDQLDDILSTTGQTFLGTTVGCARCHDHKIDPVPQKDYYKLLSFFHGVSGYTYDSVLRPIADPKAPLENEPGDLRSKKKGGDPLVDYERKLSDFNGRIAAIEESLAGKLVAGEKDDFKFESNRLDIMAKHAGGLLAQADHDRYLAIRKQREDLIKSRPAVLETALAVSERGLPRDTFVLMRGMPAAKGDRVEPGFLSVVTDVAPRLPAIPKGAKSSGRRTVLADWIADAKNPLTSRVMANRLFQHVFGRGIVRSANDFGYQGTPPTHPELLDHLATDLVAGGWKMKRVIRKLVTGSAFRMSTDTVPALMVKDPANDLLARFDQRRLTAEEVRDTILALSGNLNRFKSEGPSVYPTIPPEVLAGQSRPGNGWGKSSPQEEASRSVFVYIKRSLGVPQLVVFDAPDPDSQCPVRFSTTQPTQALVMLNSRFLNEQARVFAEGVAQEAGEPKAQVALALRRAAQRTPTATEIDRGVKFLSEVQKLDGVPANEALRRFCLVMLNLNEVVYVD